MSWSNSRPSLVQPENTESIKFPPESLSVICHRPTIDSFADAFDAPNPIITRATTAAAKAPRDRNAKRLEILLIAFPPWIFGRASLRSYHLGVKIPGKMSVEQVTNQVTSRMPDESAPPDDVIGRVRRVRTEVPRLDRI